MKSAVCLLGLFLLLVVSMAAEGQSPVGSAPKLALLVDDFGYRYNETVKGFLEIDAPLGLSIIPGLRYSERIAGEVEKKGKCLIAHLPMEPVDYPNMDPGPGALFVDLTDDEIRARIGRALGSFDRLDGVNNHMGSRAMQDERVVRIVLEEVGRRGLFFLDSKTVPSRLGATLAEASGVVCLESDLFWDDGYNTREEIEEGLDQLVQIARRKGFAIGIGHPRPVTLEVLQEKLSEFDELGIQLVSVRELIPGVMPATRNPVPLEGSGSTAAAADITE